MLPRPRIFVKKRGSRRTGASWPGKVAEGLMFVGLIAVGVFGLYWLIDRVRTAADAGWWPWFAMVIPAALIVFGIVELVTTLWQSTISTERRAAVVRKATDWEIPGVDPRPHAPALPAVPPIETVTDSPGVRLAYRLSIDAASGWVSFTMAGICLAWNTLVAVFAAQVIKMPNGNAKWLLASLMIPFVVASIWTLVALIQQVLIGIAIGTTRVEVSHHPFYPGGTFHAFVSQTGRLHVRWLQVLLVCEEQAIYQQGTDTRSETNRVFRLSLFTRRKFDIRRDQAFEATFDLTIPGAAMHSFVSPHNAVIWAIVVRGRIARWGDFERRFPVYVYPLRTTAPLLSREGRGEGSLRPSQTPPG